MEFLPNGDQKSWTLADPSAKPQKKTNKKARAGRDRG